MSTDNSEKSTSASCANCGAELLGPYCHNCGQSGKSMIKVFHTLLSEIVSDVFGYDSRLKHTLLPMFFKPGKLTLDYIKDKRFYYVLPLRLYLICSLILLLLIQLGSKYQSIAFNESQHVGQKSHSEQNKAPVVKKERIVSDSLVQDEKRAATTDSEAEPSVRSEKDSAIRLDLGDEFSEEGSLFKPLADKIKAKKDSWSKDPAPLFKEFYQTLPYMMFVLLPLFALLIKLFYLFSNRYYVEHLIFLIHNHCFVFSALSLQQLIWLATDRISEKSHWLWKSLDWLGEWLVILLFSWIVTYIFVAMKRVYRQSWGKTIFKGCMLGGLYILLISFGFVVTLAISAYNA